MAEQSTDDTERLHKLFERQEDIIDVQGTTIEELKRQRELLLEVGEFPEEVEEHYADHFVDTDTERSGEGDTDA